MASYVNEANKDERKGRERKKAKLHKRPKGNIETNIDAKGKERRKKRKFDFDWAIRWSRQRNSGRFKAEKIGEEEKEIGIRGDERKKKKKI